MAVTVELNIIPLGVGISVSDYLASALMELENLGVKYKITSMCTIFKAENIKEAFDIIGAAHEAIFKKGAKRVVTSVRVDDRRDVKRSMEEKVESLKKAIDRINNLLN